MKKKQEINPTLLKSKIASNLAWEKTMKKSCNCGANKRTECTCHRTKKYNEKAKKIREKVFGKNWYDLITPLLNNLEEKHHHN